MRIFCLFRTYCLPANGLQGLCMEIGTQQWKEKIKYMYRYEVSLRRSNNNIYFNEKLLEKMTLLCAENAFSPFLAAIHELKLSTYRRISNVDHIKLIFQLNQ